MSKTDAYVQVLSVSRVTPSPTPTPYGGHVKLSFFDTPWAASWPVQQLLLYELDGRSDDFSSLVRSLKSSLAATLAHYLPIAGKLTYMPDTKDLVVDCSDAGVDFFEAQAVGVDVHWLANSEAHDTPTFHRLVPKLNARVLPGPVLSVQATRLGMAGVAVGMSMHHTVADGRAVWRFMDAWASACRVGSPVTKKLGAPAYGREAIRYPRADEVAREMLKKVAPNLPVAIPIDYRPLQEVRLVRRTFTIGADCIQIIKQQISELASVEAAGPIMPKPVSTFVALSALSWTAFVRSKALSPADDTYLVFPADLRSRLDPPLSDGCFGNCIKCLHATATAGDLLGDAGQLHASRALHTAIQEMEAAPMSAIDDWLPRLLQLPFERVVQIIGSPQYRVYETDFRFGRPRRVELLSMNRDGDMALFGGKGDGEVQLSVLLSAEPMEAFESEIRRYVVTCSSRL